MKVLVQLFRAEEWVALLEKQCFPNDRMGRSGSDQCLHFLPGIPKKKVSGGYVVFEAAQYLSPVNLGGLPLKQERNDGIVWEVFITEIEC